MDTKELRGLIEAYSEVYAPQEEISETQLNELSDRKLRAYIKKSTKSHKKINKKWDQGTATEKEKLKSIGHEIGQERAFKRLNKEELDVFDVILEFLQVNGYAETLEEAEWMMANLIDEEAVAIIVEAMHEDEDEEDEKEMKKGKKSKKEKEEEDDEDEDEEDELDEAFKSWFDEAMSNYDKNRKRAAQRAAARNAARDQGKTGAVPGVGYVTPRRERETYVDSSGKTRHAKGL